MFKWLLASSLSNRLLVLIASVVVMAYGAWTLAQTPVDVFRDGNYNFGSESFLLAVPVGSSGYQVQVISFGSHSNLTGMTIGVEGTVTPQMYNPATLNGLYIFTTAADNGVGTGTANDGLLTVTLTAGSGATGCSFRTSAS